jgi:methyl-accepting chemotaxis protein
MQGVKSLAQIAEEQTALSDTLAIGVRLGSAAALVVLSAASGQRSAALVCAAFAAALLAFSLPVAIVRGQKKSTVPFSFWGFAVDVAAIIGMAFAVLARESLILALPSLLVLEIYCVGITLHAALRMSVRDSALALGSAALGSAVAAIYAILRFPGPVAYALLVAPFLNAAIGALAGLTSRRYTAALSENLVTEDLLRSSRRLKMTMDIVTASIFNLHQLIDKLGDISSTMSTGARNQAAGIDKVSGSAEQLQGAMEGIAASSEKSAATISTAARFSESGNTMVQKVVEEILGIHGVVDRMVAALARINDIADQTNLLALNAAIEASRTGDEQSGFSVVADEIRKLAEKAGETSTELSKWVKQIETVIDRGGESSREAGTIFDTIARDLAGSARLIHDLSKSVNDQLEKNREVTGAIEGIGMVVEDNRFLAEAVTRIIGDLKKEMIKLEELVGDKPARAGIPAIPPQGAR